MACSPTSWPWWWTMPLKASPKWCAAAICWTRRPGSTRHGTPRREADRVALLAGLYQDDHDALTAGPPVTLGEQATGSYEAVSYTHLDVYKRQLPTRGRRSQAAPGRG